MQTLVCRLPAVPSLGKFAVDKWANHPLLHYKGHILKRKLDDQIIIRRGKKNKTVICDRLAKERAAVAGICSGGPSESTAYDSFLTQDDYVEYLRDSVRSAPVTPLQESWRKRILAVSFVYLFHCVRPQLFRKITVSLNL